MNPKLNLQKPNQENHNLTLLRQDGSILILQSWEHRLKTLNYLFHDLTGSSGTKILNRSEGKVAVSIPILSEGLDTTPAYTIGSLTHFLLGKLFFGIIKDKSILFRILPYRHRDLWCPYQLLKYSPSNDTESLRAYLQPNNLFTITHNISPWFTDKDGSIYFTRYYWSPYSDQMP